MTKDTFTSLKYRYIFQNNNVFLSTEWYCDIKNEAIDLKYLSFLLSYLENLTKWLSH